VNEDLERERLDARGIVRLRADNPGLLTLSGTNTWVVGRDPAFVVDPGPALDAHVEAIVAALEARGGLGGVALTHEHGDHTEAVAALSERFDAPVAGAAGRDVALKDGDSFGPLRAVATPGHAPDHLAYLFEGACFSGDAVLGEGSVFIAPDPGALRGYLAGLERLRELALDVLCPGHGPPVWDADAKLDQYIAHRLDRERLLLAALDRGLRRTGELLDAAWSDVPAVLRPAAAVTLAAHLDKLEEEGRLPAAVERPRLR
jgi:glyoxylase-like metal-dependent hydrolase (beta-lactamase superfamily II)